MKEDLHRYDDMLDLPAHKSKNRRPMSAYDRAAQFAPFAALKGYGDMITETARLTDRRIDLSESMREELDEKLSQLEQAQGEHPLLQVTYFVEDETKEGGAYVSEEIRVRRVDTFSHTIETMERSHIPIGSIIAMEGQLFREVIEEDE